MIYISYKYYHIPIYIYRGIIMIMQLGITAFHQAGIDGHEEIMTMLLERGANIDIQDKVRIQYYYINDM